MQDALYALRDLTVTVRPMMTSHRHTKNDEAERYGHGRSPPPRQHGGSQGRPGRLGPELRWRHLCMLRGLGLDRQVIRQTLRVGAVKGRLARWLNLSPHPL